MLNREPDATSRPLVACGVLAPVVALSTFIVAATRVPGYDHVTDTISKLSAQGVSDRWLWTAGLTLYSALTGLFALGLRRRFGSQGRILWLAVAAHAFLMVGVAFFRDDLRPGGFFTVEGALHDVLSGMAFSALVLAMLGALAVERVERGLRPLRVVTLFLGATMTAIGIVFLFISPDVQGVPQRGFVALAAIWIAFLAVRSMVSID